MLWLSLRDRSPALPDLTYGVCVRCAGYQVLRISGLCYDCLPGRRWGRYLSEPWEEVVYYCARNGLIKIGTSAHAYTRAHGLGARLLATEPGDAAVEHARHRKFAAWNAADEASRRGYHNSGEWFHPAPNLLAHIKTLRLPHQRIGQRG